jgi:hypothetical protein
VLTLRRSTIIWLAVVGVGLSSLAAACYQLWSLPELPVYLSPDLRVRSVAMTSPGVDGSTDLQHGDRVDAVEGQSVDTLADVRAILRGFPTASPGESDSGQTGSAPDTDTTDEAGSQNRVRMLDVQVRRPLHRFTIALQREDSTGGALPPGYNPGTDRLLEIDGHPLPDPVGPEQLRSIIATQSQSLLTFGRKGAIFQAQIPVRPAGFPWVPAVVFGLAFLAAVVLWRRHAQEHEPDVAAAIGLETIAFGWIGLLAFAYQWILADRVLATMVIISMCLVRPLAMFARSRGPARDSGEGLWALAIGGAFAGLLSILFHMGPLSRVEIGLFAAASVGALAVVYEMSVIGFDEGAPNTLAEGGGYLVAVLVAAFTCGFLAWLFDPIFFEEQLWRWFAIIIVGLVWFGDVLFTLRGPLASTYGNVVSVQERREEVASYLRDVADELSDARVELIVRRAGKTIAIRADRDDIAVEQPDEHLRDAIDILVQEDARIPLGPAEDRSSHPLTGIAMSMDIMLALQLHPPEFGLILPESDVVLVAFEKHPDGDIPSYASAEAIDFAQARLDARTWVAMFVEGVRGIDELGTDDVTAMATASPQVTTDDGADGQTDGEETDGEESGDSGPSEEIRSRIETLEAENERLTAELDEERSSNESMRSDRRELSRRLQHHQRRWRRRQPPVDKREELLEDELLESMSYLIDDPEPIITGGPYAGGKRFVAHCLAAMEGLPPEVVAEYDAADHAPDAHHAFLFEDDQSSNEDRDPMAQDFAAVADGGALVVSSAGLLSDSVILALCNRLEELEARLILCFHDSRAHEHSVLEGRPNNVVNRLAHRELVIPPVVRRPTILEAVFTHYLEQYSTKLGRPVPELSEDTFDWLTALSYPAQMREVQLWMHRIALEADDDVVEPAHLPEPIRPPEGAPGP